MSDKSAITICLLGSLHMMFDLNDSPDDFPMEMAQYNLHQLQGERQKFQFYAHSSLNADRALKALFDGYNPTPSISLKDETAAFEAAMRDQDFHALQRCVNPDGTLGVYNHPAAELAWMIWKIALIRGRRSERR